MEQLIYRRPCLRQVGRPFRWCVFLKPAFVHGSEPDAGVLGGGGGFGQLVDPLRGVLFLHGSGRLAWQECTHWFESWS